MLGFMVVRQIQCDGVKMREGLELRSGWRNGCLGRIWERDTKKVLRERGGEREGDGGKEGK
jgi:hypothetical protein